MVLEARTSGAIACTFLYHSVIVRGQYLHVRCHTEALDGSCRTRLLREAPRFGAGPWGCITSCPHVRDFCWAWPLAARIVWMREFSSGVAVVHARDERIMGSISWLDIISVPVGAVKKQE